MPYIIKAYLLSPSYSYKFIFRVRWNQSILLPNLRKFISGSRKNAVCVLVMLEGFFLVETASTEIISRITHTSNYAVYPKDSMFWVHSRDLWEQSILDIQQVLIADHLDVISPTVDLGWMNIRKWIHVLVQKAVTRELYDKCWKKSKFLPQELELDPRLQQPKEFEHH